MTLEQLRQTIQNLGDSYPPDTPIQAFRTESRGSYQYVEIVYSLEDLQETSEGNLQFELILLSPGGPRKA